MDADVARELRALRARAYGPDPDIHTDPVALARLQELEDAALAAAVPAPPEPVAPAEAAVAAPVDEAAREDAAASLSALAEDAEDPHDDAREDAPARRSRVRGRRRWVAAAWPVSVVAALVVGAVATSAAMPLIARDGAGVQAATLVPDPSFAWPAFFGTDDQGAIGYADHYGLTAVSTRDGRWQGGGSAECLLVIPTAQLDRESNVFSGPVYTACGAGPFPATIALTVDATHPPALQERYGRGNAVQFVFDGEHVGVFSATE